MWSSVGFVEHLDSFRDENSISVKNGGMDINLDSYYPRALFGGGGKNQQVQSRYLQDASYLRLKNLMIGYTIPYKYTQKLMLSNIRLFVSGENLWTQSKVKSMFDPETIGGGFGGSVYPLSKTFAFGLNVNF